MSIVTTFESQCRALTSTPSPDENASRFIVSTLNPNAPDNLLYLFEYKDDNNNLAKISFKFPFGESWHLSSSSKHPRLLSAVLGNRGKLGVSVFKLPDELDLSLDDDFGFSDSQIERVYEPISDCKDLVRQSHWHPENSCQLLTCKDGGMQFWDVEEQKSIRDFSLLAPAETSLNLNESEKQPKLRPTHITDLRWSSLFNCSVVAAAIGPRIYGVDTRIPDSSSASICWLIEDLRCNRIRTIDFNPNSQYYIASGGDDCRANFWDLRQTSSPALRMQPHTHWIWSIRYNPFHDQLVLTSGGDSRVALLRAQSVASEPYGQMADDDEDEAEENSEETENEGEADENYKDQESEIRSVEGGDGLTNKRDKSFTDEVVNIYEEHDDSVYATEWATDPWIFATLGFESRLVINKVPKAEKFNILF